MQIVLGIYNTLAWDSLTTYYPEWMVYPFTKKVKEHYSESVMEIVEAAIVASTTIHFILDGIQLPLNIIHSYSCNELSVILNTPQHLKKTIFWLNAKQISTEDLLVKVKQSMEYKAKTIKL